ncbi:putative uncharacterized protein DDB_G0274435 [Chenopodium quinoa]|uniref:putative uncharacterized protein DDB_G0274435 n=1 Tax=Chenopodium quinoa TaxID=63459 RepID=UPI000B78D30D|nr:putative uncharacterized protein DDB_G0274435 [Chenopodium quinoa]
MPRDKAMEKLSATKRPVAISAAKYRTNVLNRASDEQKAARTPKAFSLQTIPTQNSKDWAGDVSASGKNRKHIAHKPKRGDDSTLEADREVSKPDATQASKGGRQPEVKKDLDSARSKINDLKAKVKGLKEKLQPLQQAKKEAERAKERVGRLEGNQQQQLKAKFQSRAEEEKQALVKQMMEDYESIMLTAWEAVQPGADFSIWKSKFDQANEDFNVELLRHAEDEANKDEADGEEADSSSGSSEDEDGEEENDENEEHPTADDVAANADDPSAL